MSPDPNSISFESKPSEHSCILTDCKLSQAKKRGPAADFNKICTNGSSVIIRGNERSYAN